MPELEAVLKIFSRNTPAIKLNNISYKNGNSEIFMR